MLIAPPSLPNASEPPWLGALLMAGGVGLIVCYLLGVVFSETGRALWFWQAERTGANRPVRRLAARLRSRKRTQRLKAVGYLGDLRDADAVPDLIRALERHTDDTEFTLKTISALRQFADARALPALRRLARGSSVPIQQAAQEALAALEPAHVLLRPGSALTDSHTLLRPAQNAPTETPEQLLRPISDSAEA